MPRNTTKMPRNQKGSVQVQVFSRPRSTTSMYFRGGVFQDLYSNILVTLFDDQWEVPGQLGGALESIRSHSNMTS